MSSGFVEMSEVSCFVVLWWCSFRAWGSGTGPRWTTHWTTKNWWSQSYHYSLSQDTTLCSS